MFQGGPLSLDDLKSIIQSVDKQGAYRSSSSSYRYPLSSSGNDSGSPGGSGSGSPTRKTKPASIAKACVAVETWLKQNSDDHRAFFDSVFRLLLQEVFGLGKPKDKSWLYMASSNSSYTNNSDGRQIWHLLKPGSVLMSAIVEADERKLYPHGFTFPIETLPAVAGIARTQSLLRQGQAKLFAELPHYAGRLVSHASGSHKTEVRLSLWEYFISWLVFYAIQEPPRAHSSRMTSKYMGFGHHMQADLSNLSWNMAANAAKGLFSGSMSPKSSSSSTPVFKELLDAYIKTYIQFDQNRGFGVGEIQHIAGLRGSSARQNTSPRSIGKSSSSKFSAAKRQFMLDVMLEFWLGDVNQVESSSMSTISFVCPSQDLIASIKQLVKHLVYCASKGGGNKAGAVAVQASIRTPSSAQKHPGEAVKHETYVTLWNTKRALYRFLLRCFALWPSEQSASLKPVIDLWITYIAPWEMNRVRSESSKAQKPMSLIRRTYSMSTGKTYQDPAKMQAKTSGDDWCEWKEHILSNMPFYTMLLQYFVNLQYARAASRPESSLTDVLIILESLDSQSQRLVSFLRETEQDLHMHAMGSLIGSKYFERFSLIRHDYHELHKYALQGLPSNCRLEVVSGGGGGGGTGTGAAAEISFNLMHEKEGSVCKMLKEVIEVLSIRKLRKGKLLELTKLAVRVLGMDEFTAHSRTPQKKNSDVQQMYRSFTWHDVVAFQKRYKGDWMKRPVASYEIPIMVRFWISLSERANKVLGLDSYEGSSWLHQANANAVVQMLVSLAFWLKQRNVRVNFRFMSGWWPTLLMLLYLCGLFYFKLKTIVFTMTPIYIAFMVIYITNMT